MCSVSRSREGLAWRMECWFALGEEMVLESWIEVCCLSNRGFLSEEKLRYAEVRELGKALNM